MTFGVNLIPSNNTYYLGNSTKRWQIYADTINGVLVENLGPDVETIRMIKNADGATYTFECRDGRNFLSLQTANKTDVKISFEEEYYIDPTDPNAGEEYTAPIIYHASEWEEEENVSEPDQPIYHAGFFAVIKNSTGSYILKHMILTSIGDYAWNDLPYAQITVTMSEITVPGVPVAVSQGGTGATDANTALANLTSVFPYNGDWKTAPIGLSLWYYDTNSASTYDVPSGASFVIVIRHTYSNAVAMCFKYTSNPQYMGWNRMNGNTWSGWDHLVLTGSLSNNRTDYLNTVSGSWERHDKVVTFTCQFTVKSAFPNNKLGTAISGLPVSTKISSFLVNANYDYAADTQRTASAYNGYLYLGGPYTTGVPYMVSGSYVI